MTPSSSRVCSVLSVFVFLFSSLSLTASATTTGSDSKAIRSEPGAPAASQSAAAENKNRINAIHAGLKNEKMAEEVAGTLYGFMWKDYVGASFRTAQDGEKRLQAAVKEWVVTESKHDASRLKVAQLYVVLLVDPMARRLISNMEPWTGKTSSTKDNHGAFAQGQLQEGNFVEWTRAFLADAEIHAHKILTDPRPLAEVKKDVVQNEDKPTVAAEMPKPAQGSPLPSEQPGYAKLPNWEYLYAQGGKAKLVGPLNSQLKGDKDPDAFSREISLKIASIRDESSGKITNELRIYDYTDKGDIFYQSFPLTPGVVPPFQLDDRKASGVKRTYSLTIEAVDGDLAITFCMPKNCAKPADKDSEMPGQIRTTRSFLDRARLDQAASVGVPKTINGQDYFVLDQGGQSGGKLFFPGSIKSDRTKINTPEMLAEVSEWDSKLKKNIVNTEGKIDIGMVGDKRFHLKYVKEPPPPGFDVFPGEGDPPKPKPQPVPPTTPPAPGPNPVPNPNPGTTPPDGGRGGPNSGYSAACTATKMAEMATFKQGDWTFFLPEREKQGTSFTLCINETQSVFVPYLPVEGGIREETVDGKKFLLLDVVQPKAFVKPDRLEKGQVLKADIPGQGEKEYPNRFFFYISPDQLSRENIEKVTTRQNTASAEVSELSAVKAVYNVSKKREDERVTALTVSIRDSSSDPKIAQKNIEDAVALFAKGSALHQFYQKSQNKEKLLGYILAEAEKYRGKNLELRNSFTLSLYWNAESTKLNKTTDAVYPVYDIEGVSKAELLYCPIGGMHFETGVEHRAGTLHKK